MNIITRGLGQFQKIVTRGFTEVFKPRIKRSGSDIITKKKYVFALIAPIRIIREKTFKVTLPFTQKVKRIFKVSIPLRIIKKQTLNVLLKINNKRLHKIKKLIQWI